MIETFESVEEENMPVLAPREAREDAGGIAFIDTHLNEVARDSLTENLIQVQADGIETGEIAAIIIVVASQPGLEESFIIGAALEIIVRIRPKFNREARSTPVDPIRHDLVKAE